MVFIHHQILIIFLVSQILLTVEWADGSANTEEPYSCFDFDLLAEYFYRVIKQGMF